MCQLVFGDMVKSYLRGVGSTAGQQMDSAFFISNILSRVPLDDTSIIGLLWMIKEKLKIAFH
jgi:hypothetical protein